MSFKRRPIKSYGYRKRFLGTTAAERMDISDLELAIIVVAMIPLIESSIPEEFALQMLIPLLNGYIEVAYEPDYTLERPLPRKGLTVAGLVDSDIPHSFRFRDKEQLLTLMRVLQIPETVLLSNGSVLTGEEVFLFALRRMSYPSRYHDLLIEFGGEISVWSRAFNWFIEYIYTRYSNRVLNALERHIRFFPACAAAIRNKVIEKGCVHLTGNAGFRICGFIDNTLFSTCRPGGGPVRAGPNSPRHDSTIQEAFYTGWKHTHGVKIQTVTLPNGLIADVYGPVSIRHNDLYTLANSDLNERLMAMQANVYTDMYAMYGDSAYPNIDCIASRHEAPLSPTEQVENLAMSSARESIEWVNNDIKSKFAFVCFHKGLHLRGTTLIPKMIVVAALLTNCYKCFNGCNTAEYFGVRPPTIDEYFDL